MDNTKLREELVMMIDSVPEENLEEARRLLRELLESRSMDKGDVAPLERARVRPEVLLEIEKTREEASQGHYMSHVEAGKELFGDE